MPESFLYQPWKKHEPREKPKKSTTTPLRRSSGQHTRLFESRDAGEFLNHDDHHDHKIEKGSNR